MFLVIIVIVRFWRLGHCNLMARMLACLKRKKKKKKWLILSLREIGLDDDSLFASNPPTLAKTPIYADFLA